MSSLSQFDLVNRALVRVGANKIVSFGGSSVESETAAAEYEPRVQERLSGVMPGWQGSEPYKWNFAKKVTALGVPSATAPADKWQYAYNLPSDMLAVRAVRLNDHQINWERTGAQLYTDAGSSVVIEYTFRQTEANFPPEFTAALTEDLADFFALAIKRDAGLAKEHAAKAASLWASARRVDSGYSGTRIVKASRVTSVR